MPEWQEREDDPRRAIRICDLLRMSSGLKVSTPYDPEDPKDVYADHVSPVCAFSCVLCATVLGVLL